MVSLWIQFSCPFALCKMHNSICVGAVPSFVQANFTGFVLCVLTTGGPLDGLLSLSGRALNVHFSRSGLDSRIVLQLTTLADMDRDGHLTPAEFAAAMHLVSCVVRGAPVPTIMPSCVAAVVTTFNFYRVSAPHELLSYFRTFDMLGPSSVFFVHSLLVT